MKRLVSIFFSVLFVSEISLAMVVFKAKGTKVLVLLQGSQVQIGQQLQVLDSDNKLIGQLKVSNISQDRALAVLVSGKAVEKSKVIASTSAAVSTAANHTVVAASKRMEKAKQAKAPEGPRVPYLGSVLLGLASNNLAIKVGDGTTTQNVDNTGNSISLSLAVDRLYFQPWFRVRGLVAYEQFNAIGAANIAGCANQTSRDCSTDIKYLSVGGYGKFVKDFSQFQFWGALGLNIKHPISKSSTALVESSLGTTAAYGLTLGVDYTLETKNFLTASVEKQFYLKSDSAETSTIFVRVGFGKEF